LPIEVASARSATVVAIVAVIGPSSSTEAWSRTVTELELAGSP
jgi:hypothetical protein